MTPPQFLMSIGIVLLRSFLNATYSFSKFQTVERTFYADQRLARYVRVDLRGLAAAMAKQRLYVAQVGATLQ